MRAKRTWEATFDAIVDPLAIVDREFRIVRTNLAHAQSAGKDIRSINGRLCYEVMFDATSPCAGCPVRRTFDTGAAADAEVHHPLGAPIYRAWAFPMRVLPSPAMENEVVAQAVCHYRDVTEEHALQQKLLQSEKMACVGTLAGGVAHEINNPLGAILAFTQLARQDVETGSMVAELLDEVESAAQRCKKIVASLLDFSRPSRGDRRPVSLRLVVDQSLFLCRTQFKTRPVVIETDIPDDLPAVTGDRNQLEQVVMNLITNAYQAMPGKGEIRITARAIAGESVTLTVADTGTGIEDRYLASVFEPFFTTKPEGQGTGLGLSITYSIIADHGGRIDVDSEVGRGTTFVITLPWPTREED